jgi:hypothetical protein
MEDSVVKSVDIKLKDNLIRNLKKKLHQNQTKNKRSIPEINRLKSYLDQGKYFLVFLCTQSVDIFVLRQNTQNYTELKDCLANYSFEIQCFGSF